MLLRSDTESNRVGGSVFVSPFFMDSEDFARIAICTINVRFSVLEGAPQ